MRRYRQAGRSGLTSSRFLVQPNGEILGEALVDSTGGSSCTQRKVVSQDTKMPEKLEKLRLQEHAL
ncbi:hypothetical protein EJB05_26491, partial [Eragrostis curvula]